VRRLVSLIAVGLLAGACSSAPSPTPSQAPTAAPTTGVSEVATFAAPPTTAPTAPPTAAPTPSPVAAIPACVATHLAARITSWDSGAGHRFAHVEVTNAGFAPCRLASLDRPQLVDGHGSVLIDGTDPAAPALVTVAAGGVLMADVDASNYCGPDPVAPVSVAFVAGGLAVRFVATPVSSTDSSGVPPCLGSPGDAGDISMTAWQP
jgi:Protein of unknown function (DUF4232)